MNFSELFPNRFLKSDDLNGFDVTVTVERVFLETLEADKGPEQKVLIQFKGKSKQLVANRTNCEAFRALWGNKVDDWHGRQVTIFPTQIPDPFWKAKEHPQGTPRPMIPCIRVRGAPDLAAPIHLAIKRGKKTIVVDLCNTAPRQAGGNGTRPPVASGTVSGAPRVAVQPVAPAAPPPPEPPPDLEHEPGADF